MKALSGVLPTGSVALDEGLEGGIPWGAIVLVESEEGAGGVEYAMTAARSVAAGGGAVRFASALRSSARVRSEFEALFPGGKGSVGVDLPPISDAEQLLAAAALPPGGLLVFESASALGWLTEKSSPIALFRRLADAAAARGVVLVVLAAPGALPPMIEVALAESSDIILTFGWLEGGPMRRRLLRIRKVRGLGQVLDADQVPIFEVGIHRGRGLTASKISSLL